jgi:hypothetical protein
LQKTLAQDYLRFNLYDSPNTKMVLLPDKLSGPILINLGLDQLRKLSQEGLSRGDDTLTGR